MNIDKAINHFDYKLVEKDDKGNVKGLKKLFKPSLNDVKALNAIIEWKSSQEKKTALKNDSLCKLWIEKIITLSRTRMYNAKRCIEVVDEILSKSTYECCLVLKEEIPMMRFNSVGSHKHPLKEEDYFNIDKIKERNIKIINEYEKELSEAFISSISEEDVISFVAKNINRIINKYEKNL